MCKHPLVIALLFLFSRRDKKPVKKKPTKKKGELADKPVKVKIWSEAAEAKPWVRKVAKKWERFDELRCDPTLFANEYMIEHCTGIAKVMGSNPVQAWIFSSLNFTTA